MIKIVLKLIASLFKSRKSLIAENLALCQQLATLQRSVKRPKLSIWDRLFWVMLFRCWDRWKEALHIVQPEAVIRWHREGFKRYWTWKSRRHAGRPGLDKEIHALIQTMSRDNPLWGAPRIHGELQKLGIEVSQATVSKYMVRFRRPPSQTWRTFLTNHMKDCVATDFFTVPTATFRILYVHLMLAHDSRQLIYFNVTAHPTASWTAQQMVEAFPWESAPRFLLRDRDGIYGNIFSRRVASLGIEEVVTAPRSPWQNAYVERVIGSIRRECLNHVIVMSGRHLTRMLKEYIGYYHDSRTHLGLNKETPKERITDPPENGNIVAFPRLGGLHHHYERRAA